MLNWEWGIRKAQKGGKQMVGMVELDFGIMEVRNASG
jgi:hypothetical protein